MPCAPPPCAPNTGGPEGCGNVEAIPDKRVSSMEKNKDSVD